MFFGASLKPGVVCAPTESDGGNVLHLSQACLVNPTSNEKTYLQVSHEGKTYCLCSLQKDKTENVTLDLFVSTQSGVKFQTTGGKNEVHIIGYFEPTDDDDSDMDDDEQEAMMRKLAGGQGMEESDSDAEESDEETNALKALIQAKMAEKLKAGGKVEESDDDDEDDADDDEDNEQENDEDDSGDEESEDESPQVAPTPPQKKKENKATTPQPIETVNKKRKAEEPSKGPSKGAKQQKVEKTSSSDSSPEGQWEKSVVDFLKKNGRQSIATLATKVKRPEGVKNLKYGAFLKSRSAVFAVEGQNVSLKA